MLKTRKGIRKDICFACRGSGKTWGAAEIIAGEPKIYTFKCLVCKGEGIVLVNKEGECKC